MNSLITPLLVSVFFSLMIHQPAFAHAGVDHSKSCFLTVGDGRLRISGYLHPEGKHFCHFFPELGQIVLTVEPMKEEQEKALITLELAALTSLFDFNQAFSVIKQQAAQPLGAGLVSISEMIQQRGIYRLNVILQDASGKLQQQHFMFLVGVPVTKMLVMIAGLLLLLIVFVGVRG